ncbi:MAG: CoA synthetase [Burkholderiaceae bacterium]|nr:CoA synthetase [Burkholderiaceae bacterium]
MSLVSLQELAGFVPDGARLALSMDDAGVSMAATVALIARGVRNLHLICVPVSGLQTDLLIGADCVRTVETSAVSLGEFGAAPRFTDAVRRRAIRVVDATCPAIYAGLQASQKGIPFMPLRGILETDLLAHRNDWAVIPNPFSPDDRIVAIGAIRPDVALFHAPMADRHGNVFLGRWRDGLLLGHASKDTLVTVEKLVDGNLLDDEARAGSVLPAMYVSHIAVAPQGAWPLPLQGSYGGDSAVLAAYASAARTDEGFATQLTELMEAARLRWGVAALLRAAAAPIQPA